MAYIGQGIKQGTFKVLDTSGNTYNGSNTTFSLGTQVGAAAQLLVSHDGVIQLPGTDYTLASGGASITFSTAPASGASIFITEISGAVGGTVTPSDNSVGVTQLNLSDGSNGQALTTNGSGTLSFSTISTGLTGIDDQSSSNDDQLTITDTAVVINEDSDDVDFRVEGNGVANLFHVNAGDDRIGINSDADLGAAGTLHIKKSDSGSSSVNQYSDNLIIEESSFPGMTFLCGNSGAAQISFGDNDDDDVGAIVYDHNTHYLGFNVNASERMRIASNGYLKCPGVYNQSAGDSANVVVDGSGNIYRSTSALKYKQDVRDLESIDISSFRPVRYKSKSPKDDPNKDFLGFIADEFHDAGLTELVFYGNDSDGKPTVVEGFNYDRLTVILTKALQEANAKIATLEAKVKTLEEG